MLETSIIEPHPVFAMDPDRRSNAPFAGTGVQPEAASLETCKQMLKLSLHGRRNLDLRYSTDVPGAVFRAGVVDPSRVKCAVETAEKIRQRCTPWVTLILGPRLVVDNEPRLGFSYIADDGDPVILLDLRQSQLLNCMHQQIWHVLECYRAASQIAAIANDFSSYELASGGDRSGCDPRETLARCYASFAVSLDGGLTIPAKSPGYAAFLECYSGAFARSLRRRGLVSTK